MKSHNINPLRLIDQRDLLAGGELIALVYEVRHPASTSAYRITGILIADSINTKKSVDDNWDGVNVYYLLQQSQLQ
jgi:hypothetical protein